jgi:hypothetical protein
VSGYAGGELTGEQAGGAMAAEIAAIWILFGMVCMLYGMLTTEVEVSDADREAIRQNFRDATAAKLKKQQLLAAKERLERCALLECERPQLPSEESEEG